MEWLVNPPILFKCGTQSLLGKKRLISTPHSLMKCQSLREVRARENGSLVGISSRRLSIVWLGQGRVGTLGAGYQELVYISLSSCGSKRPLLGLRLQLKAVPPPLCPKFHKSKYCVQTWCMHGESHDTPGSAIKTGVTDLFHSVRAIETSEFFAIRIAFYYYSKQVFTNTEY